MREIFLLILRFYANYYYCRINFSSRLQATSFVTKKVFFYKSIEAKFCIHIVSLSGNIFSFLRLYEN